LGFALDCPDFLPPPDQAISIRDAGFSAVLGQTRRSQPAALRRQDVVAYAGELMVLQRSRVFSHNLTAFVQGACPYPRTSVDKNLSDLARRLPELVYGLVDELVASGDKNSYWIAYRACRKLVKKEPIRVMDLLEVDMYKIRRWFIGETITNWYKSIRDLGRG
jgi:hypothetical protein